MQKVNFEYKKGVLGLILLASVARLVVAGLTELSLDEVYYWLYAVYPDWSHFDHPPMVGLLIKITTLNELLHHEVFVRLGAAICSALSTWLVFKIGIMLKNERLGFFAAILYTTSIYASVLSGTFIIPDTTQSLFWFVGIYIFMKMITAEADTLPAYLTLGLVIALAVLSKYHGVFIGVGIFAYWVFYQRSVFATPKSYLLILVALLGLIPIVWWNYDNDFITFTFHGDRVSPGFRLRFDFFFAELGGQIAYNNPVNWVLILLGIIGTVKGKNYFKKEYVRALLWMSLPLLVVFSSFALFRKTLPHWSGPAYNGLLFFGAAWLEDKNKLAFVPKALKAALWTIAIPLVLAVLLINYYPGTIGKTGSVTEYGRNDFTLDMYGWRQLGKKWTTYTRDHNLEGVTIINSKYFPSAHIDFYMATPNNQKIISVGTLSEIHKYYWIDAERLDLKEGDDAYYLTVSNWYRGPEIVGEDFENIVPLDTMEVTRSGATACYAFIYKLEGFKGNDQFYLKK